MNSEATSSKKFLDKEFFDSLPTPVHSYIFYLESTVQSLEARVRELEARLSKNSSNSSKPPSSDGMKKRTQSLRGKSAKKSGGQTGHVGKGKLQIDNPDKLVVHVPENCEGCLSALNEVTGTCVEKRQIFDIPQPKVEVTEHRIEEKKCPCCGHMNRATFPEAIKGPVQYGNRIQAMIAYFSHQHFIPSDRLCQIFEDIFDIDLSPGTCANLGEKLFENLTSFETGLKSYLLAAQVLHFDETGLRCEKKLYWVHVASSQMATLYTIHAKRGREAMDTADILPSFQGFAVHDHWLPYFSYKALHVLCNAHHLRELTFVHEQEQEEWAKRMKDLLIFAKKKVERYQDKGSLPRLVVRQIEASYAQIIQEGVQHHAQLTPLSQKKRGKPKQRVGKNLLDRLQERRVSVLWFLYCFAVPFTNNQGERDIRMVKLKQKIAGCFRTFHGGKIFCRIRSYISTARKQGWNILDTLMEALQGNPRQLAIERAITVSA